MCCEGVLSLGRLQDRQTGGWADSVACVGSHSHSLILTLCLTDLYYCTYCLGFQTLSVRVHMCSL